ncbi:MAG: hypothetical protein MUP64_13960, partial [Anaerolineae bacterium]|nr:hypothetical protein [Anaerolineae bacterium]
MCTNIGTGLVLGGKVKIAELGFNEKTVPPLSEIDLEALTEGTARVQDAFRELTAYLAGETRRFHIIFVSSFGLVNEKRLGL